MNLLPKTEKENLKKGLRLRFVIVALLLLSASFLASFIMLLPSYFLAFGYFSAIAPENQFSGSNNEDSIEKILNLPAEINSKLGFFQSNVAEISEADYLSKIVGYLPGGVRLNSVVFSRNQNYKEKNGIVILASGIATNRDSLVSFSTLLKESALFSAVDVPVSSLTKDRNLPFSVNIFIEN
ncbi:MAG: hypothetical protein V1896_01795 [Candidatus Zambryskibacteria bacterium]